MKKSGKLASHAVNSLQTLQKSLGIVALFENIYEGVPMHFVFSNIGEDVQYLVSVKSMM
jgi:hypothetical protein